MRTLFICLIAAWLMPPVVEAATLDAVVRKSGVKALVAPQVDAAVVTALKQNTAVKIVGQSGLWYQLELEGGKAGFVRINDVRLSYAATEDSGSNLRVLTTGRSGQGRVTETAGVRGMDKSDLQAASKDAAQLKALEGYRSQADAAARYAEAQPWPATTVPFPAEAKPASGKTSSGKGVLAGALGVTEGAGKAVGLLGQGVGSLLGSAKKVVPKSEEEQAEEELALGPEISGRVLGARKLWADAGAQRRVNLIGRWVASQTSRPELPWTFGVIDSTDVNAFAAPGGYILITRAMYELAGSDEELAAVLGHEISHCVQRDHYNVIRKQEMLSVGKEELSNHVATGGGIAGSFAREYVEKHGATILLTALDRDAEFRADQASEIYLARSGMNPMALYSVLQKMMTLGEKSAALAQLYNTHPPLNARLDRIDGRSYKGLEAYVGRESRRASEGPAAR